MSEIVAFGDDGNDIDMLQACGVGVAISLLGGNIWKIIENYLLVAL